MSNLGLSHTRAKTYISDPIHDKISITIFERDFIDSIHFQRLHFVLQTSTNFASFPSNKSTRFPHSLGVSHIAGRLFANAASNASSQDLKEFLRCASDFVERVVEQFSDSFNRSDDIIAELTEAHFETISGQSAFIHSPLVPDEMGERVDTEDTDDGERPFTAAFLIDTLWQSIRVYALMHDLGHLPMSHAFEKGLQTTEDILKFNNASPSVSSGYEEALSRLKKTFTGFDLGEGERPFFNIFKEVLSNGDWKVSIDKIIAEVSESDIHEVRGLHIFNRYIRTAKNIAPNISRGKNPHLSKYIDNYARLINIITVFIIFSKSIKTREGNKSQKMDDVHPFAFLYSMKRLVDGEIDADRLDYTLRDCHEAGAQFGSFDLESIVNHCVLFKHDARPVFVFGYDRHAVPAIEQFFETRYQSYKYIINHRVSARSNRCMEAAIAHMYAIACLDTRGPIAGILKSYGYFYFDEASSNITILPDLIGNGAVDVPVSGRKRKGVSISNFDKELIQYFGHRIDDFSFRSMCLNMLSDIRARLGTDIESSNKLGSTSTLELQLASLLEIVLFRVSDNIVTLFRSQTTNEFVSRVTQGEDQEKRRAKAINLMQTIPNTLGADDRIQSSLAPICKKMSSKHKVDFGIYLHYIDSKVFVNDFDNEFAEDRTLIRSSKPQAETIVKHSSALGSMAERKEADMQVRIYAVSKDLKQNYTATFELEQLVEEAFRKALED